MKCPYCSNQLKKIKRDYQYTESGLDNVILSGINVYECSVCKEVMPEIMNIESLHKTIALNLIKKDNSLNGKEVRFLRKQMGYSGKKFASVLGVDPVSVSRWETSNVDVGITNDKLIRMLFIHLMEEECNEIARNIIPRIESIKRSKKSTKIKISSSTIKAQSFCLSL